MPFRKVLEFDNLFFYVLAPHRSLFVLPRDPYSFIGVITSNPRRMLLRGNSSAFAGWLETKLYAFPDACITVFDNGKATPETHGTMALNI